MTEVVDDPEGSPVHGVSHADLEGTNVWYLRVYCGAYFAYNVEPAVEYGVPTCIACVIGEMAYARALEIAKDAGIDAAFQTLARATFLIEATGKAQP